MLEKWVRDSTIETVKTVFADIVSSVQSTWPTPAGNARRLPVLEPPLLALMLQATQTSRARVHGEPRATPTGGV
jgi:hypothetical protein